MMFLRNAPVLALAWIALVPAAATAQSTCAPGSPCSTVAAAAATADQDGFYLRSTLGAGYGHLLYLESQRNGGGPVVAASITLGHRFAGGLFVGGTFAFEPNVYTTGITGVSSGSASWGPLFSPLGYLGPTVGYSSGIFVVDVTLGAGGGGNQQAGGFGVVVAPSIGVAFASAEAIQVGVCLRPVAGVLASDHGRTVIELAGTLALFLEYR